MELSLHDETGNEVDYPGYHRMTFDGTTQSVEFPTCEGNASVKVAGFKVWDGDVVTDEGACVPLPIRIVQGVTPALLHIHIARD